MLKVKENSQRS